MVVVVNGMPRAGKSTFVAMCRAYKGHKAAQEYSTVDYVKELAMELGWNGEKTLRDRKFLSDLKALLTEWKDIPYQKTLEWIKLTYRRNASDYGLLHDDTCLFIHCREPEEIRRFKADLGDDCVTVLVRRAEVENEKQSNRSDSEVFNFEYDHTIVNNGTLDDLQRAAIDFLHAIGQGKQKW